jgi:hypothetical protein
MTRQSTNFYHRLKRCMPSKSKRLIVGWNDFGLTCLYDVSEALESHEQWNKDNLFHIIKTGKPQDQWEPPISLRTLLVSAMRNKHLHPALIEVETTRSLATIKRLFKTSPNEIKKELKEKCSILIDMTE